MSRRKTAMVFRMRREAIAERRERRDELVRQAKKIIESPERTPTGSAAAWVIVAVSSLDEARP